MGVTNIEKGNALKRQNFAGTGGTAGLTSDEQKILKEVNSQAIASHDPLTAEKARYSSVGIIPAEIVALQKIAANAGQPGYPNLTPEQQQILKDYYQKH